MTKEVGAGGPLEVVALSMPLLVLSIFCGEGSVAEIGRRHQVPDVTLAKWLDGFLAGGGAEPGQQRPARAAQPSPLPPPPL